MCGDDDLYVSSAEWTLERMGSVLTRLEPVRAILRRIARESRDEHSREQAAEALKLLEIDDAQ